MEKGGIPGIGRLSVDLNLPLTTTYHMKCRLNKLRTSRNLYIKTRYENSNITPWQVSQRIFIEHRVEFTARYQSTPSREFPGLLFPLFYYPDPLFH